MCHWAGSAAALSCLRHGVTDAYRAAAEADAAYVVVRGTLRFDESRLPRSHQASTPERRVLKGEIEGVAMGPMGQRVARSYDIQLEVSCAGPWCAEPRMGDTLAFLRKDGARYVLEDSPCGAFLFNRPRAEDVRAVQACLDAKPCRASPGR